MIPMFGSAELMWRAQVAELLCAPKVRSRNGDTREVVGWAGQLANARHGWAGSLRGASLGYAFAELLWYFLGTREVSPMLTAYAPSYMRFTNFGQAMGSYGDRWLHNPGILHKRHVFAGSSVSGPGENPQWSSLRHAVELLRESPDDRRAVVSFWDSGDVVEARRGEWKDIPCTLSMQLLARGGELHAVVNMRSNDAWLGGVYDVLCFTQVQILAAAALNLQPGTYTHCVGSMHLYEKDAEKAVEAIRYPMMRDPWQAPEPTAGEAFGLLEMDNQAPVLLAEEALRTRGFEGLVEHLRLVGNLPAWSSLVLTTMGSHLYKEKK